MHNTKETQFLKFFEFINSNPNFTIIKTIKNNSIMDQYYSKEFLVNFWKDKKYKFTINSLNEKNFIDLFDNLAEQQYGIICNDTLSCIISDSKKSTLDLIHIIDCDETTDLFDITSVCGLNSNQMIYLSAQGDVYANFNKA